MRRLRWTRLGGLFLLGLLVVAGSARADDYKDGLDALEAGQWAAAEERFRAAIADKPEAKKRLFARTYVPYYFLGVALAEQGKCQEALQAFAESEHQGVIADMADELADLQRRREACRRQVERRSEIERARNAARESIRAAQDAARSVASLREAPDLVRAWGEGSPSLARREAQARARLDAAVKSLEAMPPGAGDPQALGDVKSAADEARRGFEAIQVEAQRLRGQVQENRRSLRAEVDAAAAEARSVLEASEDLTPYPPSVTEKRREIVGLLERRDSLADTATLAELEDLRDRLRRASSRLEDEAAGPPGQLVAAAEALFSGRYGQVLEILEDQTFPNRRANAHAHLLRAAARYYLYEAGERQDEALLEAARRDAAVGRRMDSGLTAPQRAFPPGFLKLWDEAAEPEP